MQNSTHLKYSIASQQNINVNFTVAHIINVLKFCVVTEL